MQDYLRMAVRLFFAGDGAVYLGSPDGLYRSRTTSATPIWENQPFLPEHINGIFPARAGPYACCYGSGIFQEIPGTGGWIPVYTNLKDRNVHTLLETPDGSVFVGCESGIFQSADSGKTWKQVFAEGRGLEPYCGGWRTDRRRLPGRAALDRRGRPLGLGDDRRRCSSQHRTRRGGGRRHHLRRLDEKALHFRRRRPDLAAYSGEPDAAHGPIFDLKPAGQDLLQPGCRYFPLLRPGQNLETRAPRQREDVHFDRFGPGNLCCNKHWLLKTVLFDLPNNFLDISIYLFL